MAIGRRLFDHDPVSGLTTWFEYDPLTKTSILRTEQDVEREIDLNVAMANDTGYTKRGVKRDWLHYAHIPDALALKMFAEHGINIWSGNKEDTQRAFDFVNQREYKKLKTTEIYHRPRGW